MSFSQTPGYWDKIIEEGDIVKVRQQDQTTPLYQIYLMSNDKDDIKLSVNIAPETIDIPVTAGHGFTTDDHMLIIEGDNYIQSKVKNVSGDTITISTPVVYGFTTGATIIRGRINLGIDPSGDPDGTRNFNCYSELLGTPIDVETVKIIIVHTGDGDDSKFGDIAALTNGLRFKKENAVSYNLGSYRDNATFEEFGADIIYSDKAGGGLYSTKITFHLKEVFGNPIRLDPDENDSLLAMVQDDLSGLTRLRVSVMAQFTLGE